MSSYALSARSLDSGTTPGTFETLLAVKFADTLGHRGRLRSIHVGGDDDSDDIQITAIVQQSGRHPEGMVGAGCALMGQESNAWRAGHDRRRLDSGARYDRPRMGRITTSGVAD